MVYFADNSEKNAIVSVMNDVNTYFQNCTIVQVGIQALPGTKVYFNGGSDPVIIGFSGVFELDLTNSTFINSIMFDEDDLQNIADNSTAALIVDFISITGEDASSSESNMNTISGSFIESINLNSLGQLEFTLTEEES